MSPTVEAEQLCEKPVYSDFYQILGNDWFTLGNPTIAFFNGKPSNVSFT